MKKKKVRIFFDTETYTNYKGFSIPYLIGWVCDLDINNFQYSCEPHDDFFAYLEKLSKDYKIELWAHNVQYDLGIIYPNYLARMPHQSKKIWQVSEKNDFIRFRYVGKAGNNIKFSAHCTYRWVKASLASWAAELKVKGLQKGEIDYDKKGYCKVWEDKIEYLNSEDQIKFSSLADELNYLKQDVLILHKVWERICQQKEKILELFHIDIQYYDPRTVSSFGSYLLNRIMGGSDSNNLYNKIYKSVVNKDLGRVMENTRMGGFTAYNRTICAIDLDQPLIKSYDINSMYPWIMVQGLPYGDLLEEKTKSCITWYMCNIKQIAWKPEYSFFSREPVSSSFKKEPVFLCEMYLNLLRRVTNCEIEIIKEYYQEFEVRREANKLVDTLFKIKSDPKADAITKDSAKKAMNSQYGKFMQRNYHKDYYYDLDVGNFIEIVPDTPRDYRSNLTGCYIVQVAQSVIIHSVIQEHKKGNTFVYCDTDSIKMVEKVAPSFSVGSDLGDWKLEGCFNFFMNNGKAKKYFLWNYHYPIEKQQIKMSGITNKVKEQILKKFAFIDYWTLYDKDNNVLIKKGTKCSCTGLMGQKIINNSDVEFNKGKGVTHVLDLTKEEFLIKTNRND